MNTVLLVLTIVGFGLHLVPALGNIGGGLRGILAGLFGGAGGSTPAPTVPSPSAPDRPVIDLIHAILIRFKDNPTAAAVDAEVQMVRQLLDAFGVKPLITVPVVPVPSPVAK